MIILFEFVLFSINSNILMLYLALMEKEVAITVQAKEACPMIGILTEAQETETMNQGREVHLETTNEIMTVIVPRLLEIIISEIMMIEMVIEGMIEEVTEVLTEVDHLEAIGAQEGVSEALTGAQGRGSEAIEGLNFEMIEVEEAATEAIVAPEVVLEDLTGTGNIRQRYSHRFTK